MKKKLIVGLFVILSFGVGLYAGQKGPRLKLYQQQSMRASGHIFQTWIVTDTRSGVDYLVVCGTGCAVTPMVYTDRYYR